jgi:hypothetical protein
MGSECKYITFIHFLNEHTQTNDSFNFLSTAMYFLTLIYITKVDLPSAIQRLITAIYFKQANNNLEREQLFTDCSIHSLKSID